MAIPFLNHLDLQDISQLQNAILHKTTSGVASTAAGKIIFDTGSATIKYYNGTQWVEVASDTDNYVDGVSLSGTTLTLTRTGALSDLTVDLSSLDENVNDATITISAGTLLTTGGDFTTNQGTNETITINHASVTNTPTTSAASPSHGGTFTAIDSITVSTEGHVTGVNTKTVTLPADNNTDTLQSISEAGTADDDFYLTSVLNATGAQTGYSHSALRFNPSTETLITQNLIVSGTSTTINTETINLADNIITLNSNYEGSTPSENAGIEVKRGTASNVSLQWNETADNWEFEAFNHAATPVLTTYKIPRTYSETIGDGSSQSFTVTHNLGTKLIIVQLYDTSSGETVYADVARDSENTIAITTAITPTVASIRVLISTAGA